MALKVDIWSDIACPWCYVGQARLTKALALFEHRDEVELTWHSYQLDPSLPERFDGNEAEYLMASKGLPLGDVQQMLKMVTTAARSEDLPLDFEAVVPANSLPAHHLLKTVTQAGGDVDGAKQALFAAHFAEGEVISDAAVLVRIGIAAGLTEEQVHSGLADTENHAAVQADFELARKIGVTGVPFFIFGEKYAVSGARKAELLLTALERAWADSAS
jgi:predicted DsbA family dithiol-disulfide isomerase